MHPLVLEADEMQDYPLAGWIELIETLKRGSTGAQWRCHGVSRGVRDKYWELTQEDSDFTVHRYMAMHRPNWSDEERAEKIKTYGGSRQNPDYRRNIYGDHGDATNPVFVLARLMACVDQNEDSEFNAEVYQRIAIEWERLRERKTDDEDFTAVESFLDVPGTHLAGHQLAPKGYAAYYGGMDVGVTDHPSEVLLFGERAGQTILHWDLLLRIHMKRIPTDDQKAVVRWLFRRYGAKLKGFGIDKTGLGYPIWDQLVKERALKDSDGRSRVHGFNFSGKAVVGFEDRPLERNETNADLGIERYLVEHATDTLRNDFVDPKRMTLPFDRELLLEWQGQTYTIVKSGSNPYGKRDYSRGKFHTLDAGKMAVCAKTLPPIESMMTAKPEQEATFEVFVGASW